MEIKNYDKTKFPLVVNEDVQNRVEIIYNKTKFPLVVNEDVQNRVEIIIDEDTNKPVVLISDSGYDCQIADLIQLLTFVKKNIPVLWDAINTKMDKSE